MSICPQNDFCSLDMLPQDVLCMKEVDKKQDGYISECRSIASLRRISMLLRVLASSGGVPPYPHNIIQVAWRDVFGPYRVSGRPKKA